MANNNELQYILRIKDEATKSLKGFGKSVGSAEGGIKAFAKTASVSFAAVSAAAIAVGVAVEKIGTAGGKLLDVQNSFSKLAENAGSSGQKMLKEFQEVTKGTVSNADLMQRSVKASMLGIPMDKMSGLMNIARTQAVTMGEDVGYMLDSIVTGVGRASPLILDNLGITLKMGEVYENAAKSLGKSADAMTDAERKQALLSAVLEWGAEKQEEMGGSVESNAEKFQKLSATVENIKNNLLMGLVPILLPLAESFSYVAEKLNGLSEAFANGSFEIDGIGESMKGAVSKFLEMLGILEPIKGYLDIIAGQFGAFKERLADSMGIKVEDMNLDNFISGLKSKFGSAIDEIKRQMNQGMQNMFDNSKLDNMGDVFGRIMKIVTKVSDIFFRLLSPAIDNVKKAFEESKPQIDKFLQTVGPLLVGALQIAAGIIATVVVAIMGVVSGLISAFSNALPYIIQFFTGITEFISGFINLIVGIFTGDGQLIIESVKQMGQGIWDVIVGFFGGILEFIGGFISGIIEFFQHLYDVLVGHSIIPDLVEAIVMWFQNLWDRAVEIFTGIVEGIIGFITNLKDRMIALWEGIKGDLIAKWNQISAAAKTAWDTIKTKILTAIKEAWTALVNEFGAWKTKIFDWGKNIANSFVEGFKQAIGKIKDAAISAFESAKSVLKGNSPPQDGPFKTIDQWGFNVGDAWTKGFIDAISQVPSDITGLGGMTNNNTTNNTTKLQVDAVINTPMDADELALILGSQLNNSGAY